jgi:hypothetical protein
VDATSLVPGEAANFAAEPLRQTRRSCRGRRLPVYESCAYGVTRKKSRAILFDREANQFA